MVSMGSLRICIPMDPPSTRGVAPTDKVWRDRNELTVGFLNGDQRLHNLVMAVVRRFPSFCNMRFARVGVPQDAVIRVTFDSGGSYSFVGTDNLSVDRGRETMNFGWLEPDMEPTDEVARAVILHEFGHALGLVHEHSHPKNGIPWNRPAVYRHYAGLGWTKADVDHNVFARFDESKTQFSEYDRESVMHYPVPNELTIGDYEVPWQSDLSDADMVFLNNLYPYSDTVYLPLVSA